MSIIGTVAESGLRCRLFRVLVGPQLRIPDERGRLGPRRCVSRRRVHVRSARLRSRGGHHPHGGVVPRVLRDRHVLRPVGDVCRGALRRAAPPHAATRPRGREPHARARLARRWMRSWKARRRTSRSSPSPSIAMASSSAPPRHRSARRAGACSGRPPSRSSRASGYAADSSATPQRLPLFSSKALAPGLVVEPSTPALPGAGTGRDTHEHAARARGRAHVPHAARRGQSRPAGVARARGAPRPGPSDRPPVPRRGLPARRPA
jgi:hypothetical protein